MPFEATILSFFVCLGILNTMMIQYYYNKGKRDGRREAYQSRTFPTRIIKDTVIDL